MSDETAEKKSAAAILVELALEGYEFGCTEEGEPFAIPMPGGHVVRMLRGGRASLRAELSAAFRKTTGRIAPQQALSDALLVLEGEAQATTPRPVHLRVAEHRGVVYVDLGDVDERAVRITPGSWEVVDRDVPVLFRRTALSAALPTPERGGSIAELWDVLNIAEQDRALVLAWLVAALAAPSIPHPVLAVFGEQGTGKSTVSRTLVELVDPSPVPLRKPPRDSDGWVTAASGSWVVGLDNLSAVPDWLSDTLCRAVTGDGDVRRQLYTDAGLAVFSFRRAIILNGIDLAGLRGDLADRLAVVNVARIDDDHRLSERDITRRWATAYPRLVGVLLDEAAGMLQVLPTVHLGSSPRMADFALIVAALDELHGSDGFERYAEQATTLAEDSLAADPFIVAMFRAIPDSFEGTAAELLDIVTSGMGDGWRSPRGWPASARNVTGLVKRQAPALRKAGWSVDDLGANNKRGVTRWRLAAPARRENTRKPSPPNPPKAGQAGKAGLEGDRYGTSQDECRICSAPLLHPASRSAGICSKRDDQHRQAREAAA